MSCPNRKVVNAQKNLVFVQLSLLGFTNGRKSDLKSVESMSSNWKSWDAAYCNFIVTL